MEEHFGFDLFFEGGLSQVNIPTERGRTDCEVHSRCDQQPARCHDDRGRAPWRGGKGSSRASLSGMACLKRLHCLVRVSEWVWMKVKVCMRSSFSEGSLVWYWSEKLVWRAELHQNVHFREVG